MRRFGAILVLLLLPALPGCGSTPPLPEGEMPVDFYFQCTWERSGSTSDRPVPPVVKVSIAFGGAVTFEVDHQHPRPAQKTGEASIDDRQMAAFYEQVRQTDLFAMPERQEGPGEALGTLTLFVVGRNRVAQVVEKGTRTPVLEALRVAAFDLAGPGLLEFPEAVRKVIVLDTRNFVFHRSESPEVQKIPPESRREFPDPWAALDAGGIPAPDFGPLKSWD